MFFTNLKRRQIVIPRWEPQSWFVLLASIFGLLFILLVPPQKGPDEWAHFFRAYQVSNFHVMALRNSDGTYGGMIPRTMIKTNIVLTNDEVLHNYNIKYKTDETWQLLRLRLHPRDRAEFNFTGSALYSPVPYLGAALAIEPGKLMNLSPITLIYLARIGTLAFWILLVYWAIRLTPWGKWGVVALALVPVSLFQASVISADGATNGLAFLLVAYTLKLWLVKEKITRRQLLLYSGILTLLALAKPTYALLALLALLIPNRNFGSIGSALTKKSALIALCFAVAVGWVLAVRPITTYAVTHFPDPTVIVSQVKQQEVILSNPWGYALLMGDNLIAANGDPILQSAVGMLGSYDTPLPLWVTFWVVILIAITLLSEKSYDRETQKVLRWKKTFVGALALGSVILVLTTLYLTYTPVGWGMVYGMQGRYLLAISALLVPISLTRKPLLKIEPTAFYRFILGSYTAMLVFTTLCIYFRYYIDARIPLLGIS